MRNIINIAKFTLKENISKNSFNGSVLMGILFLFLMFFLKKFLMVDNFDFRVTGFYIIEGILLLTSISSFAFEIIKERENNEIYLLLSKSVKREEYILGKILGFSFILLLVLTILGIINAAFILWEYGNIDLNYIFVLICIYYKLLILTGLSVLFSVSFEKVIIGIACSLSFYILSYFIITIKEAYKNAYIVKKIILEFLYYIVPNYSLFSYKEYFKLVDNNLTYETFYVIVYLFITVVISNIVFKNKKI